MSEYFVKISASGAVDLVEYTGDRSLFMFLRAQLDCSCIESVVSTLDPRSDRLVVDECFLCKDPAPRHNALASCLYSRFEYPILGDALYCRVGLRDGEPDLVGYDYAEALRLCSKLKRLRADIMKCVGKEVFDV